MEVLNVIHLNKQIHHHPILKDISFCVQDHEIVGFVGPNGAGKSTTMKCIAGLYHPTSGEIIVNGHSMTKERNAALDSLGVSIEYPSLYPDLTGREHLKLVARWRKAGKERVSEMASFSGLGPHLDRKVKHYSMGMKQRLVLALAMLPKPEVLILDEPMNGLDPQAVFELREKLFAIRDQGTSIFLSSHQLSEVEQLADRILFIQEGTILTEKTIEELRAQGKQFRFHVSDLEKARRLLPSALVENGRLSLWVEPGKAFADRIETLVQNGVRVYEIEESGNDLENVYRQLYEVKR